MSSFLPRHWCVMSRLFCPTPRLSRMELWRHFEQSRLRGVNVWILSGWQLSSKTRLLLRIPTPILTAVYPWNPNDPSGPYVRAIYIDVGANPQIPSEHDTSHSVWPVAYFYGGASWPVTAAQVTLLTNYVSHGIGYGGNIH